MGVTETRSYSRTCSCSDRTYRVFLFILTFLSKYLLVSWFLHSNSHTKMSAIRLNYSEACEALVNKQINMELYASYVYQSIAFHFDRDDIALKGFHQYFKKESGEEREHAEKFMKYQNSRGGRIVLQDVKAPAIEWDSHIHALEDALALERKVTESLYAMHSCASDNNDAHLADFLEENFLDEQVEAIKKLSELITNAKRCGDGLGVFQFDHETMAEL